MGTQFAQAVFTPNVSMTTNTFAQQAILASSIAQCAHLNNDLQTRYDMSVRDFNANMEEGVSHNPPLTPPAAPKSWVVLPPDSNGYQFYDQIGPVLSPTPPLTVDATDLGTLAPPPSSHTNPGAPGVMQIGVPNPKNPGIFSIGPNDTEPDGYQRQIIGPGGNLITVRKVELPWGGFYETIG